MQEDITIAKPVCARCVWPAYKCCFWRATVVPGVHHRHLHPHLSAVHPADAAGAGDMLLLALRDSSAGNAARAAATEGG